MKLFFKQYYLKFLKKIRPSSLFIFFILVLISAPSYAQSINLDVSNMEIRQVIKKIEQQSDYRFFYTDGLNDLDRKVNLKLTNKNIDQVLLALFDNTQLGYQLVDNKLIMLIPKGILQQITVTGTVTDSKGEPLPGVTVSIKGSTQGTATNANGFYSLQVPNGSATLVFSYIGFTGQELLVGDRRAINVTLSEDTRQLDEVVVIGYGTQRKGELTSSISSINMKTMKPVATQRVDQMLQGRAPGVFVLNTEGTPGGNTLIRVRGMNSIQGGNNALIVIDGFQGGDLTALNPSDIEAIEILKDASATAIYGAQGANGVVLVTTKRGVSDKPVINYSSEVGFSKMLMGGVKMMTAAEAAREVNLFEMANDLNRVPVPRFTDAEIADLERTGGTNWFDEIFRTAITQNHRISMSGKTARVNYYASGSIFDQEGILINSDYKRYSLRANMLADVTDWLKFDMNWDMSQQKRTGPTTGGAVMDFTDNPLIGAFQYAPFLPVYDENGNYAKPPGWGSLLESVIWNPVQTTMETFKESETTTNNINLYLIFTLAKGLTLRTGAGFQIADYGSREFYNEKTPRGSDWNGAAYVRNTKNKNIQSSNVLTYANNWGDHRMNAVLVGEYKSYNMYASDIFGRDFAIKQTGVYNLSGANIKNFGSDYSDRKILSGVARAQYSYADKYLLTASFRSDGSSVFGKNNKWANFPSFSAGWRITKESFMSKLDFLSNMMLRASWGKTGNQGIAAYQTLSRIAGMGTYPMDGGTGITLGYGISSAANPNLKWETTTQKNIGIDLGFFKNRLRITAEYYDKVTDDLLMNRDLPTTTGLTSMLDNVGSIGNKGWEFSVDGDMNFGELSWTTGASLSIPKTTVLSLGDTKYLSFEAGGSGQGANFPFMYLRPGERFGNIEGFGYEGVWKTGEEEQAGRYGQMPGDPKYTDVNNDGKINYDGDWKVIGNALPTFIYGWSNQFRFKNWDLNFLIQGTYGNDLFNVAKIRRTRWWDARAYDADKLKRWTPENQNTNQPGLITNQTRENYRLAWNAAHPNQPFASTISWPSAGSNLISKWVEDASYLRLKNLTIAYNLPMKKYISNLRLYVTGTNLLTFTKYSGLDPEVSSYTSNDAQLGTDFWSYPAARFYNFGIDITF